MPTKGARVGKVDWLVKLPATISAKAAAMAIGNRGGLHVCSA